MSDYQEYLQSEHWLRLAEETKRLAGYRCQVCNSPDNLCAHHRTYERRGDELQSDLVCLCRNCHEKFHGKGEGKSIADDENHYMGIEIEWDEDHDERIKEAIRIVSKNLSRSGCKLPRKMGERKGNLTLYYGANDEFIVRCARYILSDGIELQVDNDFWNISIIQETK